MFPLFFFLLLPLLPAALPVLPLPEPDPVRVQSLSSPPSSVIPAFPEQSDVSSSCHLSLPSDLSFLTSLPPSSPSSRFCPALAAALYAAYASSALSLPAARPSSQLPDLPDLPDDPEFCAGEVDRAMRARGLELPRPNATCDAAYCYCGVRLRRMSCEGGFVADAAGRSWVPRDALRRTLGRGCRRSGLAGCNACLRALNQLNGNVSASASKDSRECQLMGVTWLLARNTTLYLPTATSVLRAFMASPDQFSGSAGPASCSVPHDEMPFAVGSDEINGEGDESSGVKLSPINVALLVIVYFIFL
ncbi:putative uncharacterized GPI-anchored protein [Iris pallida]|uniref:Uncharacterized GPI-anchored protein n=1 Tax=Iris pallida TaxID=29817 RepID=A0AAX6DM02_IRIPA|nr:putative uncharacterized GPI-anchored protein [Iris pallida]